MPCAAGAAFQNACTSFVRFFFSSDIRRNEMPFSFASVSTEMSNSRASYVLCCIVQRNGVEWRNCSYLFIVSAIPTVGVCDLMTKSCSSCCLLDANTVPTCSPGIINFPFRLLYVCNINDLLILHKLIVFASL